MSHISIFGAGFAGCAMALKLIEQGKSGAMLISSCDSRTVGKWNSWLKEFSSCSDARILSPNEAQDVYDIPADFFGNNGGLFKLDSRDKVVDFRQLNYRIWDFLQGHPLCTIHENAKLTDINDTYAIINGQQISASRSIVTIGT